MLKGLILIAMLLAFYPLPVALAAAALVRLALGWHGGRKWIILAALAPLPQCYIVLVAGSGLFAPGLPAALLIASMVLTAFGLVGWWLAVVRGRGEHYWLEPVLLTVAAAYLLAAVSSWIAH